MLFVGLTAAFFSIFLLIFSIMNLLTSRKTAIVKRLENFVKVYDRNIKEEIDSRGKEKHDSIRKKPDGAIGRFITWLEKELSKTDLPVKPWEYVVITLIFSISTGLILLMISGNGILFILGLITSVILSRMLINIKKNQRITKLGNQLVDTITLLSNGLKAGYSFLQACEMVSRDMRPPMSLEFRKMLRHINVGMPMEEALTSLSERMENEDMDLVVTAMLIQRQIGGNLAEVLDKITDTIQQRIRLKRDITVKTAQGKLSGFVLVLLSPALALFISIINPGFIGVLFTNSIGWLMIGLSVLLQIMGIYFIVKIIKIEV